MTIALMVISDGRPCHAQALLSAGRMLPMSIFDQVIHVDDHAHELGFAGAIQHGWDQLRADWVFHLEADFTFNAPVAVQRMVWLLERHPELVQLVLKRQPWNKAEIAAGGIIEQAPGDYLERHEDGDVWAEHRRFFSTNPCVYSTRWTRDGWPQTRHSEGVFTHQLLTNPQARFAFWGAMHDPPLVHHIGERTGTGY